MAEFCEPCPLRGECSGEIETVIVKDVRNIYRMGERRVLGRFAVAIDANGNPSEPITYSERFAPGIIEKELKTKLENKTCINPVKGTLLEPGHCGIFNSATPSYEATPASYVESKSNSLARVLKKHRNLKRAR